MVMLMPRYAAELLQDNLLTTFFFSSTPAIIEKPFGCDLIVEIIECQWFNV
jgi:hypothetical protein